MMRAGFCTYFLVTTFLAGSVESYDPACPCIGRIARENYTSHLSTKMCLNVARGDSVYCYTPDYGTSECKTWDAGQEPDCDSSSPATYCAESWCYVNATACQTSSKMYAQSTWFKGLYYSYSTCNSDASQWRDVEIAKRFDGKVIRIAYPMSYYPNFYREDAEGSPISSYDGDKVNGTGDYQGIFPKYWKMIEQAGGFTSRAQFVSSGSRAFQSSSWTACVQDVANGVVDICPGDFWNTAERYGMVSFTMPVYTTKYYVMVHAPKPSDDFIETAFKVFTPLTFNLWLSVLFVTLGVGILRSFIFVTTVKYEEHEESYQQSLRWHFCSRLRHDVWLTVSQLVNPLAEDDEDVGRSRPLRLLNMAWGVFIFFVLAAYSANLTAFMVKHNLEMPIKTIDDCVTKRCTLCVDKYRTEDMEKAFAQKISYKVFDHADFAILAIANKECDAALVEERYYRIKDNLHHPDLVFVGQAVLSYFVGFPATPEVRETISYLMNKIEGSADAPTFHKLQESYFPSMKKDPFRDPMQQDEGKDAERFDVGSMLGVMMISAALMCISILLAAMRVAGHQIISRMRKAEKSKDDHKEDANDHGNSTTNTVSGMTAWIEEEAAIHGARSPRSLEHLARKDDINEIKLLLHGMQKALDGQSNPRPALSGP